jgi:hypothetical protein
VTVVGGSATFSCTSSRLRPMWFLNATGQSDRKVLYDSQDIHILPEYHSHIAVINSTSLTLMNVTMNFAGNYKCQNTPNSPSLNELELVVLGNCLFLKLRLVHDKHLIGTIGCRFKSIIYCESRNSAVTHP